MSTERQELIKDVNELKSSIQLRGGALHEADRYIKHLESKIESMTSRDEREPEENLLQHMKKQRVEEVAAQEEDKKLLMELEAKLDKEK